ncbi:DBH-like monooxygenase protein 1 [Anneissia japonica]|uniref:DBH-like monooxygenase protein 1 n=1 Tax=Anneissia japonica TaxID=1529436 RepID=UPI0014259E21|nr:DBH-like monooxygenase protein 1 [Anneissia japonica]
MINILSLAWCIAIVTGHFHFEHEVFLDRDENIKLLWSVEDDNITFEVRANTTGYVGIGFSTNGGMRGADIILGWVKEGTPYISDRHGIGNEEPVVDVQKDVELLYGSETDDLTILGFRRKLLTCDPDDNDIGSDTIRVIWAYHPDDPEDTEVVYHGPQRRGVRSIIFIGVLSAEVLQDAMTDDVLSMDLVNEHTLIPSGDTTYWCTHYELTMLPGPHHIIRIEPVVEPGNEGFVHHMNLIECYEDLSINSNSSLDCRSENMFRYRSCEKVVYGWAVGGGPLVFPEQAGYPVGARGDVRYFQLQVHYDNPQLLQGSRDNSGVRIYYTPKLRQYDASMLVTGLPSFVTFVIPPKEEAFTLQGTCERKCSEEMFTEGDLRVFSIILHAHLAATGIRLTHYRNGEYIGEIARDTTYDFNLQEQRYLKEEWIVKPGDDLFVECTYNTMDREAATFSGAATTDEMCLAFLSYYPKANAGKCYNTPNPNTLEKLLNLGDLKNQSLHEAIYNLEWTSDRRDGIREWYRTSRVSLCTNHSGLPIFSVEDISLGRVRISFYFIFSKIQNY